MGHSRGWVRREGKKREKGEMNGKRAEHLREGSQYEKGHKVGKERKRGKAKTSKN